MSVLLGLALCVGSWADGRAPLGDSGWSVSLPADYDASPWTAPPATAGKGYVVPGWAMGGHGAFLWTSAGAGRGMNLDLATPEGRERAAYVQHHVDAAVDVATWKAGKPPDSFLAELCGAEKLPAPPVQSRVHGRLAFSYACGVDSNDATDRGASGKTAGEHFVVLLGTGPWTPFTPLYYKKALVVVHLTRYSEWSNVFRRGVLSTIARAKTDFRNIVASLAPKTGDDIPPPSATAPPVLELVAVGAKPVVIGGSWNWQVRPPAGFEVAQERKWLKDHDDVAEEELSFDADRKAFASPAAWPIACAKSDLRGAVSEVKHLDRRAVVYRCAPRPPPGFNASSVRYFEVLDSYDPATREGRVVTLRYEARARKGGPPDAEAVFEAARWSIAPAPEGDAGGALVEPEVKEGPVPLLR